MGEGGGGGGEVDTTKNYNNIYIQLTSAIRFLFFILFRVAYM